MKLIKMIKKIIKKILMSLFFPYFKKAVLAVLRSEGIELDKIKITLDKKNTDFEKLLYQKKTLNKDKLNIAVFGVLPPEKNGIAIYNAKTFGISNEFHVFSRFIPLDNYEIAKESIEDYDNNFFPINLYSIAKIMFNYSKKIFVLGNSFHNTPYLDAAINEQDKNNSYLYLHEINVNNLLHAYLDFSHYQNILAAAYPEIMKKFSQLDKITFENIKNEIKYGIRAVLLLTDITNIFVNNDNAKELLLEDIKGTIFENTLSITTLFHPFSDLRNIDNGKQLLKNDNSVKIGSFGLCDNRLKSTDTIVDAVALLNEIYNINARYILAGYNAELYIHGNIRGKKQKYVIGFSNLTNENFVSIIKQIDIAVQLRNYPHGESSGTIFQLLSLNKKIITSAGFMEDRFEKYCQVVPKFISAEELAKKIIETINTKDDILDTDLLLKEYSFKNLSEKILGI